MDTFQSEPTGNPLLDEAATRQQLRDIATRFGWTVTELPNNVDVFSHPKRHAPQPGFPKPDFDNCGDGGYPATPFVVLWHDGKQYRPTEDGWRRDTISAWSAHFIFDVNLADKELDFTTLDGNIIVFPPQPDQE